MNDNRTYDFIRYISKNGDMALVSQSSLNWARGLSHEEKVALYAVVRDQCQRLEREWRGEFAIRVGIEENQLPAVTQ